MFLMTSFLKKPDTMTTEEFRSWWQEEHAPAVRGLAGLRRYEICMADARFSPATRSLSTPPPYDGVAMLWFDAEADFLAAVQDAVGPNEGQALPDVGVQVVSVVGTPITLLP